MQKIIDWLLLNKFYVIFASLAVLVAGLGVVAWQLSSVLGQAQQPITAVTSVSDSLTSTPVLTSPSATPAPTISDKAYLIVDIGGGVNAPGVYVIEDGKVLADLVQIAGGFREDVLDIHLVQKQLNLAQSLKNGQKYYVPYRGETWTGAAASETATTSSSDSGLISINTADSKTLQTLKGIGEVRAQAIIDNRPYTSIEDLLTKSVVTQTIFTNIEKSITI